VGLVVATAVPVAVVTTGCGGSKEKKQLVAEGRVPNALDETESSAEDLVDFARARKRAKVISGAKELRHLARGPATAVLRRRKVSETLVNSLNGRALAIVQIASSASFLEISLAANQISGLMPQLYAYFKGRVPPEVLKLDYLDREAEFRSIANDQFSTLRAIKDLSSTWNALRLKVLTAGGEKAAASFSRHVEKMRAFARTFKRAGIRKEAAKGLALVDVLEVVFRRH
jgi:hypothetical protein